MPSLATNKLSGADAEACQFLIDFVYERCRVRLHSGKEALISARLGKRMRHLGFSTLAEYCHFLRTGATEDEFVQVVNALTTNFTSFMREEDHFKFLVKTALPAALGKDKKHFRVWSAACSSGEEPYTMAFYLMEHFPPGIGWDWRITASDVSTKVLEHARKAVYSVDRIQTIPDEWVRKYFQKGVGQCEGHYRIKPAVASLVDFRQINLIADYHQAHAFEVIFCRNVMIYFDRPTQELLVNQMCRYLAPGGHLIIGHSESLTGLRVPLSCLHPSVYRKT